MLIQLLIKNLAIVNKLELNFAPNMNVLTGETGAGKSILIDAINLALGNRAPQNIIKNKTKSAEVIACFDINNLSKIILWLENNDLNSDNECIIRRVINPDGKSKSYINGCPVTLKQLKNLGEQLVHVHSQHQHYFLLKQEYQRYILDTFANNQDILSKLNNLYKNYNNIKTELEKLNNEEQESSKLAFLEYQIQELEVLSPKENELEKLNKLHKLHAGASDTKNTIQEILDLLSNHTVNEIQNKLKNLELPNIQNLINSAIINLEEAESELKDYVNNIQIDQEKLSKIESRISKIYDISRKHKIDANLLSQHYKNLCHERDKLLNLDNLKLELQKNLDKILTEYTNIAKKLTLSRINTANKLEKIIKQKIKSLAMPNANFKIEITNKNNLPTAYGVDNIDFLISLNPGMALGTLKNIASGGELSRISLAIQTIIANKIKMPTMIFDEVDVGISGETAEIVGKTLRELGSNSQIICITHLPQVAALGNKNFKVSKNQTKTSTEVNITELDTKENKTAEIARLLCGAKITDAAILNAQSMIID